MKHAKLLVFLGIVVSVMPFLGFPTAWKNVIIPVLGVSMVLLAFRVMGSLQAAEEAYEEPLDEELSHDDMSHDLSVEHGVTPAHE